MCPTPESSSDERNKGNAYRAGGNVASFKIIESTLRGSYRPF